jgi:hypothetical protein
MNFGNTNTYKNATTETTEFEDILVKKGIIDERPEILIEKMIKAEMLARGEAEPESAEEALGNMSLKQLDKVEDDYEEDVLLKIRRERVAQLQAQQKREKFGVVLPLIRQEFITNVTEASKDSWVVCELYSSGIEASLVMTQLLRQVAERHRAVKFVRILSTDCVENWPDSRVPCLLLYRDGTMQRELVGMGHCGGAEKATVKSLEGSLEAAGVFAEDYVEPGAKAAATSGTAGDDTDDEDEEENEDRSSARVGFNQGFRKQFHDEDDDDF